MKKKITYLFAFFLILNFSTGYAYDLTISGRITEINSDLPIQGQWVEIYIDSTSQPGISYFNTVFTDTFGMYYDSISLPDSVSGIITIVTDSCNYTSIRTDWFSDYYNYFYNDFSICNISGNLCDAFFTYFPGSEPLTIQFIDESIGDIDNYSWEFGDGTFSNQQNPVHTFPGWGNYLTTLTITGDSCFSEFFMMVYVFQDTVNCQADFIYQLDTLNNIPNTFVFTDESTDGTEMWYWDFGDGQFSTEQSPVHVYNEYGTYSVCLNITTTAGGTICTSMHCDTVSTMEYYSFGGQAFIGDYPINIDSTENDNISTVYLFRKISNSWHYMDQREFWKYGYYWFSQKPAGEYMIFAELKENSAAYDNYASSYFPKALSWKQAGIFNLEDNEQFAVNLHFNELMEYGHGTGSIWGNLQKGNSCNDTNLIQLDNVSIQLTNSANDIIAFTYTDMDGYYSFSGLGNGNYRIHAEYTGRYSEAQDIIISDENHYIEADLTIHCTHILGIDETSAIVDLLVSEPFPNPASDKVKISISSLNGAAVDISVINANGQEYINFTSYILHETNDIVIDTDALLQGYYLIILSDQNSGYQIIKKLAIIK